MKPEVGEPLSPFFSMNHLSAEQLMAPHSRTLAWKIPWTEEPVRLQSMGSQLSNFTFTFHFDVLEKEMATHSSVLAWRIPWMEKPGILPMDGGVHGVAQSQTRLSDFTFTFHFSLSCIGEGMATHSSVLARKIPGTVEPGGLPSMGSHRVGHD